MNRLRFQWNGKKTFQGRYIMSNKELEIYINTVLSELNEAEAYNSDEDYFMDTPALFGGVTIA